jgi:hypothetical protein
VIDNENNNIHVQYDYILFLRDDTMWLQNFDFLSLVEHNSNDKIESNQNNIVDISSYSSSSVLRSSATSTMNTTISNNNNIELFVPSCDARVPSMHPAEINDHIAVVSRNKADVFGKYFDQLFLTKIESCGDRLDDTIRYGKHAKRNNKNNNDRSKQMEPIRGCNSEMILKYILEQNNVTIQYVGQGRIPFQRTALVQKNASEQIRTCFHKFCQSYYDPIVIHPELQKCKDLIL